MKQWLLKRYKLSPNNGLQRTVYRIWPKICIEAWTPPGFVMEVQSCPAVYNENRKLATGYVPEFFQGDRFQTALDSFYVNITIDNVIIPVCHPEIQLAFISIPQSFLLDSSVKFVDCDRNATTKCCNFSQLPTNINVDIYDYNCDYKNNYNLGGYSSINSCHATFAGIPWYRRCITGPLSFKGYSVCDNTTKNMNIAANEFRYIAVDGLDVYPDAVDYLFHITKNVTFLNSVITIANPSPIILEYDGDIIITDLDTLPPLHTTCGSTVPESLNCKNVDCTRCNDNKCTKHNNCVHGCKNDVYIPPECTVVKSDSQFITPDIMCYCVDVADWLYGVEYCSGEKQSVFINPTKPYTCFKEMKSPSLSLSMNSSIIDLVINKPYSKVLIISPDGTLMYIDIPSFPLPL